MLYLGLMKWIARRALMNDIDLVLDLIQIGQRMLANL